MKGPSMAWIHRLDETSCVGELCARRPRAASAGPWACAHGTEDVAPIGAKNQMLLSELKSNSSSAP